MNYVKINDSMFLVEQEVIKKNSKAVVVPKNLNHIFIYDRSGSMYGVLDTLIKDLKTRLRTVPTGDTVTIGWFSSPGEFRFPLKGLKVSGKADFDAIDKVLDANSTTLGSTCFSEVLEDVEKVVQDLGPIGNKFALAFLTDGYPTVWPYEKEVKAINKAIANVAGEITSSLLVGYGNYYNKELMADMAERFGGSLIHSSKLSDFPVAYQQFMERSRDSEPKLLVELAARPAENGAVFSLNGSSVNLYQVENGAIGFSPTKGDDYVYVLTDKKPKGANVPAASEQERLTKATYAAAYVLTQRTKTDLALDALSAIGDVALVNRVNNAYTNTEYGAVEQGIVEAIGSQEKRFSGGKKVGCLPKPDAFCVLDALELLTGDKDAEFWPQNDAFEYSRVGVGSKTKDGYPKFEASSDARVPLTDLVWNESKLNLSVRAKIPGTIELPTGYKKVGLEKVFSTFVWRNYTVVKDGFLNVQKLPVSMSKDTYEKFLAEGVIDPEHNRHYAGRAYVLHLDRLPVINRKIAEGKTSATKLVENVLEELSHEGRLKALNFMRNELEPKEERGLGMTLTDGQEEFLKECGVTRSGFNPPSEKLPATDFYMAKEFEIKVKGFSSFPKIDEVRIKVAGAKKLTPSAEVIADALKGAELALKVASSKSSKLAALDGLIFAEKAGLKRVRSDIQKTKFAVLLAKKWFSEFSSRENNVLIVDGKEVTLSVREVKVDI